MGHSREVGGPTQDELGAEVALQAKLDDSGLSVSGKSRALAAADRLLGGLVGIPAAYLEGIRGRMEARDSTKLAMIKAEGQEALRKLATADDLGRLAADQFVAEERRRYANRLGVWEATVRAIEDAPEDSADESQDKSGINPDWMNLLSEYAGRASTDRLEALWGQILAGEIRRPGSFALSTLRVISEMDVEIAETFQEIALLRLKGWVVRPPNLRGEELLKWHFLEEVGLLQGVSESTIGWAFKSGTQGYVIYGLSDYCIKIYFGDENDRATVPAAFLTRAAREIAQILPNDEERALLTVVARIQEDVSVDFGKITARTKSEKFPFEEKIEFLFLKKVR